MCEMKIGQSWLLTDLEFHTDYWKEGGRKQRDRKVSGRGERVFWMAAHTHGLSKPYFSLIDPWSGSTALIYISLLQMLC